MIYSEKTESQLSLPVILTHFYSPYILDHVRYCYSCEVNICLYLSIYFPFSLSLAFIAFSGFLFYCFISILLLFLDFWCFSLESFSFFLKNSYCFFSCTLAGNKTSHLFHDGNVFILPSHVKDTFSIMQLEKVIAGFQLFSSAL